MSQNYIKKDVKLSRYQSLKMVEYIGHKITSYIVIVGGRARYKIP